MAWKPMGRPTVREQRSNINVKAMTIRIERGLVRVSDGPIWSDGKNSRSRRVISIDPDMAKALSAHRRLQAEERLAAGMAWEDNDLVVATRDGRHVSPRNFDQTLERIVRDAGVPRLTSHGLRGCRDGSDDPAWRPRVGRSTPSRVFG